MGLLRLKRYLLFQYNHYEELKNELTFLFLGYFHQKKKEKSLLDNVQNYSDEETSSIKKTGLNIAKIMIKSDFFDTF